MWLSKPSTGPDCMMSSALPAATPPNTSNSTTSPSSFRPIEVGERAADIAGADQGDLVACHGEFLPDGREGARTGGRCPEGGAVLAASMASAVKGSPARAVMSDAGKAEIFLALHLLQPRRGALERLRALAALVKLVRHGLGRGDQLHPVVIQRVDQD